MNRERHNANEKRRRLFHASKGLCTRCTRPARPERRLCEVCAAQSRERVQLEKASRNRCAVIRWRRQRKITRAAVEYVAALRKLDAISPNSANRPDRPDLMAATRKQVQSAVRQLFAAVEKRA
jgi:hypothetical protein